MRHLTLVILICGVTLLAIPGDAYGATFRDAAQRQFEYANGLRQLGIYYEAAKEYERFIKDYPKHAGAGTAAYLRAESLYEYSSASSVRRAAIAAVRDFHDGYPNHPWKNLGYFLLGEIAMEEALDLEREVAAAKRDNQSTEKLQLRFEAACKVAYPSYRKFVELTDLAKFKDDERAREELVWRVVTAHYNTAQCLVALRQYEEAVKEYKFLLEPQFNDRGPEEAQFLIGRVYLEWGKRSSPAVKKARLNEAIKAFRAVMFYGLAGRNEFSDDARLGEGWCLYELRQYSECRKHLAENMRKQAADRPSFFAECYNTFKHNPNRIDKRWVRSLEPDIYYVYGACYFQERKYKEAMAWFKRVMDFGGENPWRAEATKKFAECRKHIGEEVKLATEEEALEAYKVALNKYVTGSHESAIDEFEQIWLKYTGVRTARFRDYLLYYWAKSYYRSGETGRLLEAAAVFNYLAKTGNRQTMVEDDAGRSVKIVGDASYMEGLAYWRLGESMEPGLEKDAIIEASMLAFERLAAGNPEHPEAPETLLNVGHFYLAKKEFMRAGYAYRRLVGAYPKHENAGTALLNLCYVYRELGQLDDVLWAAGTFESNFPKRPDVVRAIELKGAAWFRKAKEAQKPEEKKALYGKAAAEYGKLRVERFDWLSPIEKEEYANAFGNALFYAGYAYEQIEDTAKALEYYRVFVETAPSDHAHLAEGRSYAGRLLVENKQYAAAVELLRPLADALEMPDEKAHRGMATLVSALLELAKAEEDPAKRGELSEEAVARASHFYEIYGATPIHHEPYLTMAEAFEAAERFDDMLVAYTKLRANQLLSVKEAGLGRVERVKRAGSYAQLLFKSGQACGRAAEVLEARGEDTTRFDSAGGDFLYRYNTVAKKLAGPGAIPANYVEVNFLIADMLKRAKEPAKAAKALEKIIAVVPETDPRFLEAYWERGNVWLECGRPKRALASYLYVIDWADPENPARKEYMARSYFQGGIAEFRVEDDPEAKAKAKAMFETLVATFGEDKDNTIRSIVTKAREQIEQIEKREAEAASGAGT